MFFKNTAGQKVGAQLISATDGSAFTGAVTVAVTVDAGTQAAGSVGSGACTHEGGGYHTYAPAQAETNGELLAFTFSGSGAVPTTTQISPFPTAGVLTPASLIEAGLTIVDALRLIAAAAAGKVSGAAGTTVVIRNAVADTKNRITGTVDADGNRSAVTVDLT